MKKVIVKKETKKVNEVNELKKEIIKNKTNKKVNNKLKSLKILDVKDVSTLKDDKITKKPKSKQKSFVDDDFQAALKKASNTLDNVAISSSDNNTIIIEDIVVSDDATDDATDDVAIGDEVIADDFISNDILITDISDSSFINIDDSEELIAPPAVCDASDCSASDLNDTYPIVSDSSLSNLVETKIGKLNKTDKITKLDKPNKLSNSDRLSNSNKPNKIKKNSSLYDMLSRPTGATMEELMTELGWQKHSVRGVLSNLQKDQQFTIVTIGTSKPNLVDGGFIKETRYFIKDTEFDATTLFTSNTSNL